MDIFSLLKLLGGLGLFIYGMLTMGNALEKMAGEKLEKTLETVTGNIFKAIGIGALVTGIIQSSSATTVMVVGFVNAGIMNLRQAAGVIMGLFLEYRQLQLDIHTTSHLYHTALLKHIL